tara:strand:- start:104929 stop:105063 length:135 start_codon:yes stop_codon:yes gene_type:complete
MRLGGPKMHTISIMKSGLDLATTSTPEQRRRFAATSVTAISKTP